MGPLDLEGDSFASPNGNYGDGLGGIYWKFVGTHHMISVPILEMLGDLGKVRCLVSFDDLSCPSLVWESFALEFWSRLGQTQGPNQFISHLWFISADEIWKFRKPTRNYRIMSAMNSETDKKVLQMVSEARHPWHCHVSALGSFPRSLSRWPSLSGPCRTTNSTTPWCKRSSWLKPST